MSRTTDCTDEVVHSGLGYKKFAVIIK